MGDKKQKNPLDLLKKTIELCMPNLRHYYRITRKAKVVGVYASEGGNYYADVQPLRNDDSVDHNEPVVQKVEIPILWGGPSRGVVCPPTEGTFCDLSYYDGDPNYPHITNFRWHSMDAPVAALNEFVIQLEPGVEIRIDKQKQVVTLTPENVATEAGKNWIVKAGDNATIIAGNDATMEAGSTANIKAPFINLWGRISAKSYDGSGRAHAEFWGDVIVHGNEDVRENHSVGGNSAVSGNFSTDGDASVKGDSKVEGNAYATSRSGGSCPH